MQNPQINPKLIEQLTNQAIPVPTLKHLPGRYILKILKNKNKIESTTGVENNQFLICGACNKKGKYNVGLSVLNVAKEKKPDLIKDIQLTAYFRCKHCNEAGNWEIPNTLITQAMLGALPIGGPAKKKVTFGRIQLFDGSSHQYATDGEEHLLGILKENPKDAFVWNRLGNLYRQGERPELATSVFEHSLTIDPHQIESHFSLGDFLEQINDFVNAGYHLRQTLLYADRYTKIPAEKLRDLVASALQTLFSLSQATNGEVPFIPTLDEITQSGRKVDILMKNIEKFELTIFSDEHDSFYPIAEIFMGNRVKDIAKDKRTNHLMKPIKNNFSNF